MCVWYGKSGSWELSKVGRFSMPRSKVRKGGARCILLW